MVPEIFVHQGEVWFAIGGLPKHTTNSLRGEIPKDVLIAAL